jgi:secondary thiamine-phosphate synthase enzyme
MRTTSGPGLYELTGEIEAFIVAAGIDVGLLTVFVRHTSCSLLIQENADPDVRRDLDTFFRRLVPPADDPSMRWIVHTTEGPDDMPAHIKAALTQTSLGVHSGKHGTRHMAGHLSLRAPAAPSSAGDRAAPQQLV